MNNKQLLYFAEIDDISPIILEFEKNKVIHYYETGLFEDQAIIEYHSLLEVPYFGFVSFGDWNKIESYLIMNKSTNIIARSILQNTGKLKFAIDQLSNPNSIEIRPGGIYKNMPNVLIAGRIATISKNEISNELYKNISAKVKKEFIKIGSFYVGKKAELKLKSGWRLVTNINSPKEYDLKLT